MPARRLKSLDEFRVRPNLNFIRFNGPVTEVSSETPSSSEPTPKDNPPASQDELDQKDLEACRRMFDSVEQALIDMGYSKPMPSDSKPTGATDKQEKQKPHNAG